MNRKLLELNDTFSRILKECPEFTFIGNPVLRQKTTEVTMEEGMQISEHLQSALQKYRDITGFGRGLAAPQIGESKSVFITFIGDTFKTYINPEITKREDCNLYREGCVSCGNVWAEVKRAASITIEYTNEGGERVTEEADGFLARLLQHEYDHLLGIENLDVAVPGTPAFMTDDPLKEELRDCR